MKRIFKVFIVAVLEWEARQVLKKYKPKIVAITGSVGKTSTKDAIYTVMSHFFFTRKSQKSFNSEIGVPLTILGLQNAWNNPIGWIYNIISGLSLIFVKQKYPDWLVLEVGADRPGDIKRIARSIQPDITVVTRLSKIPVHVEYFGSVEDLYKEKGYLVQALKPAGTLVLNSDDEDVMLFKKDFDGETILFGFHEPADYLASDVSISYKNGKPEGVGFLVVNGNEETELVLKGSLGKQHAYSVVAAFAVGGALGLDMNGMAHAFNTFEPVPGRMRLLDGVKETMIIDDSYNSSPIALNEALNTLESMEVSGRKIAILGDMLELGVYSPDEHKKVGKRVAEICKLLFTVGVRARGMAEGALEAGMDEDNVFQYEDSERAGADAEVKIKEGDVVLVKGSQGVRMEKAVEAIMAVPQKKKRLLVRQDEEWSKR